MKNIFKDFGFSSFSTGLLICLVGYTSSALIVFEVGKKFGLNIADASSWLGVLCIGMAILTIFYSLRYKMPLMFAWSTPGAILLLSSPSNISVNKIVGAFIFSALLIIFFGVTGLFERLIKKIPASLAHAMLAGILFKFALGVFTSFSTFFSLSLIMFIVYLLGKKLAPKIAILIVMLSGILVSFFMGKLELSHGLDFHLIHPVLITPEFDVLTTLGIGLPLFIVTMTSQNLTGAAVLRSHNYPAPISQLITASGVMNLLLAPFGGFALNLSAITAAISMGPETHLEHHKRYTIALVSGGLYIFIGLFSMLFGNLFSMFPKEMIAVLTGLALIATISNSIIQLGYHPKEKDSAMLTFFITASGVTLFGIGAAFWGILVGSITYFFSSDSN